MSASLKQAVKRNLNRFGYDLVRHDQPDFSEADRRILACVRPFTMTSPERLHSVISAVRYLVATGVAGDIVECGVWRGGSMMAAALALREAGDTTRTLHLFDTYEGMSAPETVDRDFSGVTASAHMAEKPKWCSASLEDVQHNLRSTGYPAERMQFVKGKVEDTIPRHAPGQIALLRLDTDWYESTRHELEHLFPRLASRGILIIDDYGHWEGCRKAVDEYIARHKLPLFLHRVDYAARLAVKP